MSRGVREMSRSNDGTLDRREVVAELLRDPGDLLVITGLGAATYDAGAAGDRPLNFYLWGAMGGAAMIGLGLMSNTETTIKMASRRRRFSSASRISIRDRCYAFSTRSVIRHARSLRPRCEPTMAKCNSANLISANRRFFSAGVEPFPARARRRWRQVRLRPPQ